MSNYSRVDLYGNPRRRELKDRRSELKRLHQISKTAGMNASVVGRPIRLIHRPTGQVRVMQND